MVEALVVFGSKSDSSVYDFLVKELKNSGISLELKVCSAHRAPEKLEEILESTDARIIVAGAGLSAALPGVIASHSLKPVIGIPIDGNYQGLDALLSIHQMPPGIPVLGVGVNNAVQAANAVKACLRKYTEVAIVENESREAIEKSAKAEQLLAEFKIPCKKVPKQELNEDCIAINFFNLKTEKPMSGNSLVINVPLSENNAENSIELLSKTKEGFFVGVGRAENAALFAIQVFGGMEKQLKKYRLKQKQKVLEDNESESNRIKELV